jgi:NADPH-dependent glutamate synthase beta subunit-like oxidoreductase/NAD(P)H-flavin reductase
MMTPVSAALPLLVHQTPPDLVGWDAARCDQEFLAWLGQQDSALAGALLAARGDPDALTSLQESELLLALAPRLDEWLVQRFALVDADAALKASIADFHPIALVRRQFVQRRAVPNYQGKTDALEAVAVLAALEPYLAADVDQDFEHRFAVGVAGWLKDEASHAEALMAAEAYAAWAVLTVAGQQRHRHSPLFTIPQPLDPAKLVRAVAKTDAGGIQQLAAAPEDRVIRQGFALTDAGGSLDQALGQAHYCIKCHRQAKDSCRHGLREKDGTPRRSASDIPLNGCPLAQKISESHVLKEQGFSVGALAVIMVDNPLLPATGHRICNDCMKACIYQKQQPVDIPLTESRILQDVLHLPWGVELYLLLTRWNPLNLARPQAKPNSGYRVLVAGQGPAGFNLAYHLLQEGHGVVAVEGLKVEPLMQPWGSDPHSPIFDIQQLWQPLDQRVVGGFGGVAEYGITVRWDKNFLTLIQLVLQRHANYRLYGGVRLGSQLTVAEAFEIGFDHVALCLGAGRPTTLTMPHGLAKGVRMASDFLMALQLTGAAKANSPANLQLRLPVVVVGGGLTAIDTATEALAYYPVMVEKFLSRYEALVAVHGVDALAGGWDASERAIAEEFLQHGRALREAKAAANFDPLPLLQAWGGVTVAYRRELTAAPAYRLNHEEVQLALAQGIRLVPDLSPQAVVVDPDGHAVGLAVQQADGSSATLPAHSILIAAGTKPNTVLAMEEPDLVDFARVAEDSGKPSTGVLLDLPEGAAALYGGRRLSHFGDLNPRFAGNVVKAMASAKHGYPQITASLSQRAPEADLGGKTWDALVAELDAGLIARVVRVERLTPTIVELVVHAPLAARRFQPGQFFRLQNFEQLAGTAQMLEPLAVTGAWVDQAAGLVGVIVLEMGGSSNRCIDLKPDQPVVLMGPTGAPTEIVKNETVLLIGGGLGNAVLFSIGQALRANGNRVLYAAGYKAMDDRFRVEEIERAADVVLWCCDQAPGFAPNPSRPQDRGFVGNLIDGLASYAAGDLGQGAIALAEVDRIIAIGSDRMMAAVAAARHGRLQPLLNPQHQAIGSINSPMQCMMKQVCGQCVQRHLDSATGLETIVFSCTNQDQALDHVDFANLADRLAQNHVLERLEKLASIPAAASSTPKVAVLLCSYQGQPFLAAQLDSIKQQSHQNWAVWASDDGSTDGTLAVLASYQQQWLAGQLSVVAGPSKGFVANFLSLSCRPEVAADFYAYADQDDVWEADKMERAVAWLETVPAEVPALYCSRTLFVDQDNRPLGLSPLFLKPPSFANALMQSLGGGNTMVFNNAARQLLLEAGEAALVKSHDWWLYLLVTGAGGQVFYDPHPTLRYRQHTGNLVGLNTSVAARLKRLSMLWRGEFRGWNTGHVTALRPLAHLLTPANRQTLEHFAKARNLGLIPRLIGLRRCGIYRQTRLGNMGLMLAAFLKKL